MKYLVVVLALLIVLASCSTTPGVSEIPFSQEWKKYLKVNVANDDAVKCYLLHDIKIPHQNYRKENHLKTWTNPYRMGKSNHSPFKYVNRNSISQLKLGVEKIAMEAAEANFISKEICVDTKKKQYNFHAMQSSRDRAAEEKAKKDREDRFIIRCKEIGFEEEDDEMKNCILKQQEIEAIAHSRGSVVINNEESKSKQGSTFCQVMPGTEILHCW